VVPVENSTEGVVAVARPVPDHAAVHHRRDQPVRAPQPAAQDERLDGIEAVCAHPQALAQCHELAVATTCPRPSAGPSPAMPKARAWPAWTRALAGIASDRAASEYGLHVVAPAIQDDPHNRTRFAIVVPPGTATPRPSHRTRLHQPGGVGGQPPGAVHDMLVPLKTHGVSMTRFESRPARSGQWEYYFYIDLQGHPDQPRWPALQELRERLRLLQGAGHLPHRRALSPGPPMFNQLGVIGCGLMGGSVRAGPQARRPGQAGHRLQQVAVDHREARRSSA
jgi:chorismate mutase/prephenate dehydratase